jgi:hypothetical protein
VTEEGRRLEAARDPGTPWKKWGPYLSERWGTVREDYSDMGNAWDYFSHDQARSRAYRCIDPYAAQGSWLRNARWSHMANADVISMPDKWEYPWYAAWDLAFHAVALDLVDPDFAKDQLLLMLDQQYLHPSGQIPAYEWNFGDVNPPVHAWASWFVYSREKALRGEGDLEFLESIFQKLLVNFTRWVNRKDPSGANVFEGGFLGLDNIGVFDRSAPLPTGGHLEQADGTAWMAFYCQTMLQIALELALYDPVREEMAAKFYEHFLWIAAAMDRVGPQALGRGGRLLLRRPSPAGGSGRPAQGPVDGGAPGALRVHRLSGGHRAADAVHATSPRLHPSASVAGGHDRVTRPDRPGRPPNARALE